MGYGSRTIDNIIISPQKIINDIGAINISQTNVEMGDVQITSQKGAVEYSLDKMVVNVDKTLPSAGGSLLDVLKNTPSVNVDVDNNVSLRGNQNINLMIDGKNSGITMQMLQQIPASAVEKIEIVTNPSARYDAEGTAGIINIVMKKREDADLNGLISASFGTRDNYNSSINLNYKQNNTNVYLNYDNRFNHRTADGFVERQNFSPDGNTSFHQNTNFNFGGFSHNIKGGIDYSFDEFNSLSTSLLYNDGKFKRNARFSSSEYDAGEMLTNKYVNNNKGGQGGNNLDYALNYKRTFETKGQELLADFFYSHNHNSEDALMTVNNYDQSNNPVFPFEQKQKSLTQNQNVVYTFKTDYVHPLSDITKFEAGYKGSYRERGVDFEISDYIDSLSNWQMLATSNDFKYKEIINAAYTMFSSAYEKFKFQLGLRLEQSNITADQVTMNTQYKKDYLGIFPSVHLSQGIAEGQELKLSYSRRINRPHMMLLNPFPRNMDPQFVFQGNPFLNPEYINSYEFGHSIFFAQSSLMTNLFYREVNDNINQVTELKPNNVIFTTFQNIAKQKSYGIEINASHQLFKWWSLNGGYSFFKTEYEGTIANVDLTGISETWNARLSSTTNLPEGFDLQLNLYYSSPMIQPQGRFKGMYYTDLGLKKTLMEGKLTLSFRVSDVFNASKYRGETFGPNFTAISETRPQNQIFTFSLSYNLNNFKRKMERRPDEDTGGREYESSGN